MESRDGTRPVNLTTRHRRVSKGGCEYLRVCIRSSPGSHFSSAHLGTRYRVARLAGMHPAADAAPREITPRAIVLGLGLALLLGSANAYLGLYAGMTVSASIPAAVISMAILRALGRATILENNVVQTIASAGEAVAAGAIFTFPALVVLGQTGALPYRDVTMLG